MNVYAVVTDGMNAMMGAEEYSLLYEAYKKLSSSSKWESVAGVLPFGHNFTGPFADDDLLSWNSVKWEKDGYTQGYYGKTHQNGDMTTARNRMFAIDKSDVIFVWADRELSRSMYADVAYAYAKGKYIVVSVKSRQSLIDNALLAEVNCLPTVPCFNSPKDAYLFIMEGVTEKESDKFNMLTSKFGGLCRGCGGSYSIDDTIMWSRAHGAYHVHCHALKVDPNKKDAAMFSAELVATLQERNSLLENENTLLAARCSAIERQLRGEML